MRIIASLIILAISPILASAQVSTSPGYTRFDQLQQAKLRAFLGTWKCVDVPASKKPDIQTTTQVGNYFVTKETGDNPNTEYLRWSHGYRIYYAVELDDAGGTQVVQTRSLDPTNATWTLAFPTHDTNGRPLLQSVLTYSNHSYKVVSQYYDDKGKLRSSSSTCSKVS
jgi:hypothetical protein